MRPVLAIISFTLLIFTAVSANAQDDTVKIKPGIQWDTAVVIKPTHRPEHLIGVRYDYSFTDVSMTPDMGTKGVNSPVNIAVLYTYYHPLWNVIDIFGLQTGLRYTRYGFVNSEYNFSRFQQTVSVIELPLISAFHIDLGEHFRILLSIGPFIGYRFSTTKENGFDCFDNRIDYGIQGGAGLAYIFGRRFELHLEGTFHYSLSMLYHPEKMSSISWLYSYPWQASISLGLHVKIK